VQQIAVIKILKFLVFGTKTKLRPVIGLELLALNLNVKMHQKLLPLMKPVKNLYLMVHALLNKEGDAPLDQPAKQSKSKQLVSKIQKD
jgi:hypothetical protein